MNRDALKIFIACAIGAAVGTIVALDMNKYFWWLGLLAGGATGYLSYEWRAVIRAIPAAYRAAGRVKFPSKPILCRLRLFIWASMATTSFGAWMYIASSLAKPLLPKGIILSSLGVMCLLFTLVCFLLTFAFAFVTMIMTFAGQVGNEMNEFAGVFRKTAFVVSPPTVVFWHLPHGLLFVMKKVPQAVAATFRFILSVLVRAPQDFKATLGFAKRFGWQMFVRIHSERRLICGVDALLGSMIGYFAGSAAVGALAGGILGAVNYAVVTERWLRPAGYVRAR
jgi:hypothetical protein